MVLIPVLCLIEFYFFIEKFFENFPRGFYFIPPHPPAPRYVNLCVKVDYKIIPLFNLIIDCKSLCLSTSLRSLFILSSWSIKQHSFKKGKYLLLLCIKGNIRQLKVTLKWWNDKNFNFQEVMADLSESKYQNCELRLSIYGR